MAVCSAFVRADDLFLEQRPLLLHDPPRFLGGAEVVAGERLDLDQAALGAAQPVDGRGVDRRGLDGEHRRGRQRRPFALGEHLVQTELARTTALGSTEVGSRDRFGSGYDHPLHSSA